ncbi:MAG TPA: oligosaccharide flippase family protein [Steroidobacteraceae bacterium]|nr:oligosaccharide flippase family protein [Steroidobacteraceae bacterium]
MTIEGAPPGREESAPAACAGTFATARPAKRLWARALTLGAANAFDYLAQFVLPIALVRCLDTAAFAQYRLLWLAAGTVLAIATLSMPASLYYFLLRSDRDTRRLYINQTLLFLLLAGLVAGWAVSSWNPWLPDSLHELARFPVLVPAFVLLSVVASLLDLLPTVEERISAQVRLTLGLAALRTVVMTAAALSTRELGPVLAAMVVFVAVKVALLLGYVARHHGLRRPILRWPAFVNQVQHAAPIGAAGALYGLRLQADQWVAAALLPLSAFASFSVGAVLAPLLNLFRQSFNAAFLPSMSRMHAAGDLDRMVELNGRANVMVAALVYPLLAFAFVYAEEIVTVIYTASYVQAAPVMRVYIVGLLAVVIELATLTLLLRQGPFVLRLSVVALPLSVAISWYSAARFGIAGAAAGSSIAMYVDRLATLWRIARCTGIPLRRLQDWRSLALLLLLAAIAAALAWRVSGAWFVASPPIIRATVGGATLAVAYGALYRLQFGGARAPKPVNHPQSVP